MRAATSPFGMPPVFSFVSSVTLSSVVELGGSGWSVGGGTLVGSVDFAVGSVGSVGTVGVVVGVVGVVGVLGVGVGGSVVTVGVVGVVGLGVVLIGVAVGVW